MRDLHFVLDAVTSEQLFKSLMYGRIGDSHMFWSILGVTLNLDYWPLPRPFRATTDSDQGDFSRRHVVDLRPV